MAFDRGNSAPRQNTFGFGATDRPATKSAPMTGSWSEEELVAMIPDLFANGQAGEAWAGIGSRDTPPDVCDDMTAIATVLERRGLTFRSGFAGGADTAFELGTSNDDLRQVWAPWKGFGANPNSKWDKPRWDMIRAHELKTGEAFRPAPQHILTGEALSKARDLARKHHPAWEKLSENVQNLHTRNMSQVLGPNLDKPARFVIPWTIDGGATGGTGQAIRVANELGIPVLNLQRPAIRAAVLKELGLDNSRSAEQQRPVMADVARDAARARAAVSPTGAETTFDYDAILRPTQTWQRQDVASFCKVRDENGDLSNMSNEHPYEDHGLKWKSSEAQYQAIRYPGHPEIQEHIRAAPTAYAAKQVAYEHLDKTRPDWKEINVQAMAYVVTRKRQSSRFVATMNATGVRPIVEISTRDAFWGAQPRGTTFTGRNILGAILDQSRAGARENDLPRGTTFPTPEKARALAAARLQQHTAPAAKASSKPDQAPAIKASMYFSYGRDRRPGVSSASTFDAILAGERSSTTRFPAWGGYDRWKSMKPGETVRFYEDRAMQGRFVDVRVTGVEPIDLAKCSPERLEAWSQSEGWSPSAGRGYGEKYGAGVQIRYEPIPGQEILAARERDDDRQLAFLSAAQNRGGFSR